MELKPIGLHTGFFEDRRKKKREAETGFREREKKGAFEEKTEGNEHNFG